MIIKGTLECITDVLDPSDNMKGSLFYIDVKNAYLCYAQFLVEWRIIRKALRINCMLKLLN